MAAKKGGSSVINYSKWDNIELSDDEEKTPECIESSYWASTELEKTIVLKSYFSEILFLFSRIF